MRLIEAYCFEFYLHYLMYHERLVIVLWSKVSLLPTFCFSGEKQKLLMLLDGNA